MKKVAKLVCVSLMTRVVVDENANREEILEASKRNFVDKVYTELGDNLESIEDDEECPYGTLHGEVLVNKTKKIVPKEYVPTDKFGNGTSLQGEYPASYKKLEKLFGAPNSEGDGYKVSTEWQLKSPSGKVVYIYDYKETRMYDRDLPSVAGFRKLPSYSWHIGASSVEEAKELIEYLKSKGV